MKKILCSILCAGLLSAFTVLPASAAVPSEVPSESVVYMLTLDSPSLLDHVLSSDRYDSMKELIFSPEGKALSNKISNEQQQIQQAVTALLPDADFSKSRSFCAVTNGITFSAPLSAKKQLEKLPGVRSVKISGTTVVHTSAKTAPATATKVQKKAVYGSAQKATIDTKTAYDKGYTGKSTLIAVIDSEFDVQHEAFSVKPAEAAYDKEYVSMINDVTPLNIDKRYRIEDVYSSPKIIYAYDYGENDLDCQDERYYHGTHVSCIAAGNSGRNSEYNYHGVAYDAQLALFKICDQEGNLTSEALIAALDDAVKLCPDAINCSFGARKYLQYEYEGKSLIEKLTDSGIAVIASAGNDRYNGYDVEQISLPTDFVHYSTVGTPSSMDSVLSVASCEPLKTYEMKTYYLFNGELKKEIRFISVFLGGIEELSQGGNETEALKRQDEETWEEEDDGSELYDYLYLDIDGSEESFKDLQLHRKYLILNKGDIPLEEMLRNAVHHGCIGLALIDDGKPIEITQTGTEDGTIFLLDSSVKSYLEEKPTGKLKVIVDEKYTSTDNPYAGEMSYFSSLGVRSDLTLKPDITTPGSNIFSAVYDNSYANMSGTSMATPCATGSYALMKQYLNESDMAEHLSTDEMEELIYKLLMSTATPAVFQQGDETTPKTYYSPRYQGAGIAALGKALETKAYLSVDGKRPKISMKDDLSGQYTFSFTVTNLSEETVSYPLQAVLQTDDYQLKTDEKTKKQYPVNQTDPVSIMDQAQISFTVNGQKTDTVTVAPESDISVTVQIILDPEFVRQRSTVFTNGFFVDGFIFLTSPEQPELSLPFTGFCGDWSKGPIFTSTVYDQEKQFPYLDSGLAVGINHNNRMISLPLGVNSLYYKELPTELSFGINAIRDYSMQNPSLPTAALVPQLYLLRDTMDYTIKIEDMGGNLLYYQNFGSIPSVFSYDYNPVEEFSEEQNRSFLEELRKCCETLFEGTYLYTVQASTISSKGNSERTESRSFEVRVDNTEPEILTSFLEKGEDGRIYLTLTTFDNGLLQGIQFFAVKCDSSGNIEKQVDILADLRTRCGESNFCKVDYDTDTHYYTFTFDVTDYQELISEKKNAKKEVYHDDNVTIEFEPSQEYKDVSDTLLGYRALDYAYNTSSMKVIDVNHYGVLELQFCDSKGAPVKDLAVMLDGKEYRTSDKGTLNLGNLSLGTKSLQLADDAYQWEDASDVQLLYLTPVSCYLSKTMTVQKKQPPSPAPLHPEEEKKPDPKPDKPKQPVSPSETSADYPVSPEPPQTVKPTDIPDTGNRPNPVVPLTVLLVFSAVGCIFLTGRSKKRNQP